MCSDSTTVSRDIWSDGTDTAVFHPLTAPKNSAGVTNARVGWRVFRDTGGQELRAGVQYGNDGVSWDTASEFGDAFSSSDEVYQTGFTDVSQGYGTRKRLVRFGLWIKSSSTGEVDICNVTFFVDFEE